MAGVYNFQKVNFAKKGLLILFLSLVACLFVVIKRQQTIDQNVLDIKKAIKSEPPHSNPHDFQYLLNPGHNTCKSKAPTLLALVVTSPGNFERRALIRRTWANPKFSYLRAVFLLGDPRDQTLNVRIAHESSEFKDIVQEDFYDSYDNLTLKSVMAFKWSAAYCAKATFFMKVVDDDVFVLTHRLQKFLDLVVGPGVQPLRNTFMCVVHRYPVVDRDPSHKWYVSRDQYGFDFFPTYCGGPAYIFTSDLSQLLYEKSLSTRTIRMEDAYVGLLATKLDSNFLELKMDGKYLIKHRVKDMYREHLISEICSYQEYEGLCASLQEGYD